MFSDDQADGLSQHYFKMNVQVNLSMIAPDRFGPEELSRLAQLEIIDRLAGQFWHLHWYYGQTDFYTAEAVVVQIKRSAFEPKLCISVMDLDISTRAKNLLCKQGINTVGKIIARTKRELLHLEGFGTKSVNEVVAAIIGLDLKFQLESSVEMG